MNINTTEIFSLVGKTALVTGATGYLGSSMAFILAQAGANVLVNSREVSRSQELVARLKADGYNAEMAVFDITSPVELEDFSSNMQSTPLHVLINNAYLGGAGNIESSNAKDYTLSYDITVLASHALLNAMLPSLRLAIHQTGDASVINMASMYAMVSPDQRIYDSVQSINPPFYGAAKAALLQWTRYAACEFGKEGIRVNAISPGAFPNHDVQSLNPEFVEKLVEKIPLKRVGSQHEICGPALFLASSASSYITGANFVVDGGWTCW